MGGTRILASHGGVLPRPDENADAAFAERLPSAVAECVQQQLDAGMDVVNDGKLVKRAGFNGYIRERMRGIEPRPTAPVPRAADWRARSCSSW